MREQPPVPPLFPATFLNEAGLNRQHVFDLAQLPPAVRQTLGDGEGYRQLILIGHGGRRLWECIKASGIGGEHPIDQYTLQTVTRWLAAFLPGRPYRILYPGEQVIGLQQLGRLAGWHRPSPFMVGIDETWGSWFAYRAVVLVDSDFQPFPPLAGRDPCLSCQSRACTAACPAGALAGEFSLAACVAYRLGTNAACQFTCLARTACPVGSEHRYDDAQLHHSYALSLRMIRQFY